MQQNLLDEDDGAVDGILNGVWSVDCVWFGSAGLNTTVLDGEQARLMGALGMMKDGEEHMSDPREKTTDVITFVIKGTWK